MTMTVTQGIITIVCVVLGTMVTRFLPFLIFRKERNRRNLSAILAMCFPMR